MSPEEKQDFLDTIVNALACKIPTSTLTDEEHRWVKLAIQREAQSIQFRQKVIDNSLTGLIWLGILGVGVMIRTYLASVGLKL